MLRSCALLGGFAIGARDALLWQHYGNAWQSPAVIRQAQRTPHALRMRAACGDDSPDRRDKIDAPAACALPFRLYCGGIVTRTRNVTEYMLVLALCLVHLLFGSNLGPCPVNERLAKQLSKKIRFIRINRAAPKRKTFA